MKRTILSLAALATLAGAALVPTRAAAVPVEYVRICEIPGEVGWYYVPGTDTCFNAVTGELRTESPNPPNFGLSVADRIDYLEERVGFSLSAAAIGIALPNPIMPEGHTFAITGNWGQVGGFHAFGLAAAVAVTPHFLITGGVGVGMGTGAVGTRAGWNLSFGRR